MKPEMVRIISGGLLYLLADTIVLMFKLRYLSWHLDRDVSTNLRRVIRADRAHLDKSVDRLAERVLGLGRPLGLGYSDLAKLSSISGRFEVLSVARMAEQIVSDHEKVLADIETLSVTLPLTEDRETADLLNQMEGCHRRCRDGLASLASPAGHQTKSDHG